jgi:hypothetical protein
MWYWKAAFPRLNWITAATKCYPLGQPASQVASKKEFVMAGNSKKSSPAPKVVAKAAPVSSAVRNSAIPKGVAGTIMPKRDITQAEIAKRAYEIFQSGKGGSQLDNWLRAERELRASQQTSFR